VGWDVYRRLDLLPQLRRGVRTLEFSSYDRGGGNDDGFFGRYSCLRQVHDGCLIAEHRGPGELESIWSAGRPWGDISDAGKILIRLDGRTVVDAPFTDLVAGRLGAPFVFPLVADARQSHGGNYLDVPMPFRHSMQVVTAGNPFFYHVTYRAFDDATGVRTFDPRDRADDVIAELRAAGRADPKPDAGHRLSMAAGLNVAAHGRAALARLRGSGAVVALRIRLRKLVSPADAKASAINRVLRGARLQMAFDGHRTVDAPLGEFFGSDGPARVRSLLFAMDPGRGGWLSSWWPMPFARSLSITLVNRSGVAIRAGDLRLTVDRSDRWASLLRARRLGYFRTTSHRGWTVPERDWSFLDARGRGTFVGVTQEMEGSLPPEFLEGDESAFEDGSRLPQLHGTGTEDFYQGGWYFLLDPFTLPLSGFPALRDPASGCAAPTCLSAYRLMLGDAVPFTSKLRFGIEHGSQNLTPAVYGSTAYWYRAR
jgi:hypothetical protein